MSSEVAAAQEGQHLVLVDGLPFIVGEVGRAVARCRVQLDLAVTLVRGQVEEDGHAVVEALAVALRENGREVNVDHRDWEKSQ